jgi:hypothetical protein
MRNDGATALGLLLLLQAMVSAPAAAEEETRVQWVRPQRVPQESRAALTRLLAAAADGRLPAGTRVRDSRPTLHTPNPKAADSARQPVKTHQR